MSTDDGSIGQESEGDPVWRFRWVTYLSYSVVLACLAVMYLELSPGWRWSGLWWCFLSSCIGAIEMAVLYRLLVRRIEMSEKARVITRRRQLMNPWGWLFSGAAAGALSAMVGTNVIGYIVAAYVAVNTALLPWAYRAARRNWETHLNASDR